MERNGGEHKLLSEATGVLLDFWRLDPIHPDEAEKWVARKENFKKRFPEYEKTIAEIVTAKRLLDTSRLYYRQNFPTYVNKLLRPFAEGIGGDEFDFEFFRDVLWSRCIVNRNGDIDHRIISEERSTLGMQLGYTGQPLEKWTREIVMRAMLLGIVGLRGQSYPKNG